MEVPVSFTPENHHRPSHQKKNKPQRVKSFYSDESSPEDESEDDATDSSSESESDSDSSGSDSSESSSDEDNGSDSEEEEKQPRSKRKMISGGKKHSEKHEPSESSGSEDTDSSSSSSSSSESSSDEESENSENSDEDIKKKKKANDQEQKSEVTQGTGDRSNLDLLLELDDAPPTMDTPLLTPSLGGLLTPSPSSQPAQPLPPGASIQPASAKFIPTVTQELLNRLSGGGLSLACRFTRSPHLYSPRMISVELSFTNNSTEEIRDISVGSKKLAPGMSLHEFAGIAVLSPDTTLYGTLGVDFNDTTQPAVFDLVAGGRTFSISITAPIGELLMPLAMNEADFNHNQVGDMLLSCSLN